MRTTFRRRAGVEKGLPKPTFLFVLDQIGCRGGSGIRFASAVEYLADDRGSEAAALQEAHLPGLFGPIDWRPAELLLPHLSRALEFAVAVVTQYRLDDVVSDAALAQFKRELDAARSCAVVGDPAFGEAAVGQPVLLLELV